MPLYPREIKINQLEKEGRLYYIDNLRIIACFLVLLTHSTMPSQTGEDSLWIFSLAFIGSPSSELFLSLSGAVLLPVKTGMRTFYRRRFSKILIPVVFWSVIGILSYIPTKGLSLEDASQSILLIPIQPVIGVYWFIYVMVGLYLFAPIISAFLKTATKRQLIFFIFLWVITLMMPWIYGLWSQDFNQHGDHYWMLNYFGGFLGYWILGYYLSKYPIYIGLNREWCILSLFTLAYPVAIMILKKYSYETGPFLDNLQFGSAILVAFLFTILQNIHLPHSIQKYLTNFSKFCFGIYLIHFFVRDYLWYLFRDSGLHVVPKTFLIAIILMLGSAFILWVISKFPYGKKITGLT